MTPRADQAEIFAANRARGRIGLAVDARQGTTRRRHVAEEGSLRVRFPARRSSALDAVIVNTAGGIAGGDRLGVEIAIAPSASLTVTTASAEKVYRSLGPDAALHLRLRVAPQGSLLWLPQETILFDGARLHRTIDVELAEDASLVLAEALVFGRAAMGEALQHGSVFDRWRLRRGGKLVFAETVRLDGAIAAHLCERAVAAGRRAVATVLVCPCDAARLAALHDCADWQGEAAVSAWNGFAVARFLAGDGAALRYDLAKAMAALAVAPPLLWGH
jgi:urease accessory protein